MVGRLRGRVGSRVVVGAGGGSGAKNHEKIDNFEKLLNGTDRSGVHRKCVGK